MKFNFEECYPISFKNIIPNISDDGIDLMEKMLALNPSERISCKEILEHSFLKVLEETENKNQPDFINKIIKFKNKEIN